jgi:DNA-binding response OmpR family regulator
MASKTIVVVDGDSVFRTSLTDILNIAGYEAHGASDNRSAIRLAESLGSEIDLMVVNMALPDISGAALIDSIAIGQKTTIKVIASSSVFLHGDAVRDSFDSDAVITKEAFGVPAIAAKWLLTVRGLLGELADAAPVPLHSVILLADDDASVRHFVKTLLNRGGHQVLEASDGHGALALARKIGGNVDLLVTDVEMPGMDGRQLGKAIREAYSTVPVIYISGFTEDPRVQGLHDPDHGFAFVGKPFQPRILLETVSRMLNRERTA